MIEKFVKTVLIIDDDPIHRALVEAFLKQRGVNTVFEAVDGSEASNQMALHGRQLDLVISDLNMPNFDGVEFLQPIT